jgi:hypothetical protein
MLNKWTYASLSAYPALRRFRIAQAEWTVSDALDFERGGRITSIRIWTHFGDRVGTIVLACSFSPVDVGDHDESSLALMQVRRQGNCG